MSLLDALASFLEQSGLEHESLPSVIPAMIAAGSLVAFADGAADPNELRAIDRTALTQLAGRAGAAEDVHRVVERHADNFDRGLDYGRAHAVAVLADWSSAPRPEKDAVMRAAIEVGRAGSDLSDAERAAAREVAEVLGLDPALYDL